MENIMKMYIVSFVAVALLIGCAAKGPVQTARISALTAGELALEIDKQERLVYTSNIPGYDKAAHDRVGDGILKLLYAVRGYERAIISVPVDQPLPETVRGARLGVIAAIADLQKVIPAIAAVQGPLTKALAALSAWLESSQAWMEGGYVQHAQLPAGGLMGLFAILNLFASLLASGRTTYERLKDLLKREGATTEELAELDVRLTDAIAARKDEHS